MAKSSDVALLAGVAIVGYGLLKSDFFKGLGKVGTGLGDATEGLGSGISTAGQGLGQGIADLSGQITSVTGDVAELTSFVGEFGNWTAQQFSELQQRSLREHTQDDIIDRSAFDQAQDELAKIQADTEITQAQEQAKRDELKAKESTQWTERFTTIDDKAISALEKTGSFLWRYSPVGMVTNYVRNQASVESEAPAQESKSSSGSGFSITGAVVGAKSSVRSSKASSGSEGVSSLDNPTPAATTAKEKTIRGTYQGLPISVPKSTQPAEKSSWVSRIIRKIIFI